MPKKQKVLCINDGMLYESISDAAKNYGIEQSSITRQLNGERRTAKGYYFCRISGDTKKTDIKKIQKDFIKKMLSVNGAGSNDN